MTVDARNPEEEPHFEYAHIDGNEQVQKLAKDTFKLAFSAEPARVQEVQDQVAEHHRNMKKLSTALHRAWLRQVAEQRSTGFKSKPPTAPTLLQYTLSLLGVYVRNAYYVVVACFAAQSTKQKEEAATKIQAAARGRFARRRAKAIQAEKVCYDRSVFVNSGVVVTGFELCCSFSASCKHSAAC